MARLLLYLTSLSTVAVLVVAPAAFAQTIPLSCADFANREAAQAIYDKGLDKDKLDRDNNGEACDENGKISEIIANFGGADVGDQAQAAAAAIALVTLPLIAVQAIFIRSQIKREVLQHSADLIIQLRDKYFSDEGRKMRQDAAKSIKQFIEDAGNNGVVLRKRAKERAKERNDEDMLLDFFNRIGLLIQRRALDKKMVAGSFYMSVHRYCCANEKYIRAKQSIRSTTWEELSYLHREIHFIVRSKDFPRVLRPAIKLWWKVWRVDIEAWDIYKEEIRSFSWVLRPVIWLWWSTTSPQRSPAGWRTVLWPAIWLWWRVWRRNYFHGVADTDKEKPKDTHTEQFLTDESKLLD